MKNEKSSAFLIVYGCFLLITGLVSVFIPNNGVISRLALAATLSSVFFTFSDMCFGAGKHFEGQISSIINCLNCRDDFKDNDDVQKLKADSLAIKKKTDRVEKCGTAIFAIGCAVLFAVVSFYDEEAKLFARLAEYQNVLTIIAFAIVMINYWIQDHFLKDNNKHLEE